MNNETKGTILALMAAVISGIAIPANKLFIVSLDPTVFTAVRSVIIGTVFFFISLHQSRPTISRFKKASWASLLAIAVVGGALAFLLFFNGLSLTTAGKGAFLHKTLPLWTAVLAFVFLKERITKIALYALIAMFLGIVALYFTQITPGDLWKDPQLGDLLVLGAAFLWAVETIIAKKAMVDGETNFVVSFARMFFGGVILFGIALLSGKADAMLALSIAQWTYVLASTAMLFGYVLCWYWAIKKVNASKATSLLLLAPVVSLIGGVLLFNEHVSVQQLVGSAAILAGAYFVSHEKSESLRMQHTI
jgi:drug/metabolite transporter (DMT)-like permease